MEESLRDGKSCRHGSAPRLTQLTNADRLDRLLPILALASILRTGPGASTRARDRPGMWCSSNDERKCSVDTIGRVMLGHMSESPEAVRQEVVAATTKVVPKWG